MEAININDIIFATASIRGNIAADIKLSGLKSMSEIVTAIRREIGSMSGLLTIRMRNATQGWCQSKSVYLSPAPVFVKPIANRIPV